MLNQNDTIREHLFSKLNQLHELVEKSATVINIESESGRRAIDTRQFKSVVKCIAIIDDFISHFSEDQRKYVNDYIHDTIKYWCDDDMKPLKVANAKRLPSIIRSKPEQLRVNRSRKRTDEEKLEDNLRELGEFKPFEPLAVFTNYGMSQLYAANFIDGDVKNAYMDSIVTMIEGDTIPVIRSDNVVYCYKSEIIMNESGTAPAMLCLRCNDKIIHMTCMPRSIPQPKPGEDPFTPEHHKIGITFSASLADRYFNEVKKYTPFHLYTEYVSRLFVIREVVSNRNSSPKYKEKKITNDKESYTYGPDLFQKLDDYGVFEMILGLVYMAYEWAGVSAKSLKRTDPNPEIKDILNAWVKNDIEFKAPNFIRQWRDVGGARIDNYITPYDLGYTRPPLKGIHEQSIDMLIKQRDRVKGKLQITPLPGVETDNTFILQPGCTSTHAYHRFFLCLMTSQTISGVYDLPGLKDLFRASMKIIGPNINERPKQVTKPCNKLCRLLMSLRMTEIPDKEEIPLPEMNIKTPFEPKLIMKTTYDMTSEVVFATKALDLDHPYIKSAVNYDYDPIINGGFRQTILDAIKETDETGILHKPLQDVFDNWDGSIPGNLEKNAIHGMNNTTLRVWTALQRVGILGGFNQMDKSIYPGLSHAEKIAKTGRDSDKFDPEFEKVFLEELKQNFAYIRSPSVQDMINSARTVMKSASAGGDNVSIRKVLTENVLDDLSRQDELTVTLKSKIATPALMPTLFMPRASDPEHGNIERGMFEMNRVSTPTRPFQEGTRRVPDRKDDRSVKNFATGGQIITSALYDSMIEYQEMSENSAYLLAHNSGVIGKDASKFMRDSLKMTLDKLIAEFDADYSTFDQYQGKATWRTYRKGLEETPIGTTPSFRTQFNIEYKDMLLQIIDSLQDSYYVYRPYGGPPEVIQTSAMPSGIKFTANGNTIFTSANIKHAAAKVLPKFNASMESYGTWGDDARVLIRFVDMSFEQLMEMIDEFGECSRDASQVWDSGKDSNVGRSVDILRTFYVDGQMIKRFMPYDSEHPIILDCPGDISPVLTNLVDMATRGMNQTSLMIMMYSLIIMGRTDSIFGYNFTFDFFDMIMPGGLSGIMPVGFPQAASTNYMRIMAGELYGPREIMSRPRLDDPADLGLRMLFPKKVISGSSKDPDIRTVVGSTVSGMTRSTMIRAANSLFVDPSRVYESASALLSSAESNRLKRFESYIKGRGGPNARLTGEERLDRLKYTSHVTNQLASGFGTSILNGHLKSQYIQTNMERLGLIQSRSNGVAAEPKQVKTSLPNNIMRFENFNILFTMGGNSVTGARQYSSLSLRKVLYELRLPKEREEPYIIYRTRLNERGVPSDREEVLTFKRCFSGFLYMPMVVRVLTGLLGMQTSRDSFKMKNELIEFDASFRKDMISSEQVLEMMDDILRDPENKDLCQTMLRYVGFKHEEAGHLMQLRNRIPIIKDKLNMNEYSSNPDVLKSLSLTRLFELFRVTLDPNTYTYIMDGDDDGLKENVCKYYVSLLYDQINVACSISPPASEHLYVPLPEVTIKFISQQY